MTETFLVTGLPSGILIRNRIKKAERQSGWLDEMSSEIEVEKLSDARILALSNLQLPESQQETLHELLEKNGEGELTKLERKYLDDLMEVYNDALLTKAKAMRIAVKRGLIEPLSAKMKRTKIPEETKTNQPLRP